MLWLYILLGVIMAALLAAAVVRAAHDNVRSRRGHWSLKNEIRSASNPKHSR